MGSGIEIGLSGIRAAQQAMLAAGNNITNANTPGYSKRTAVLSAQSPLNDITGVATGRGVVVENIVRESVEFIDFRMFTKQSAFNNAEARSIRLADLEGLFNELGDFSLKGTVSDFFGAVEEVAKLPGSNSARVMMVETAKVMTEKFNQMSSDQSDMLTRVRSDIKTTVKEVNNLTIKLADLNSQIASLDAGGIEPHTLMDQRDNLLNELSGLISADVKSTGDGLTRLVAFGGRDIVTGSKSVQLGTTTDQTTGDVTVIFKSDSAAASATAGALKGMLDFQIDVNTYKSELDKLAAALADEFNRLHSEGVNLNGSFSSAVTGKHSVSNAGSTLDTANLLPFTPSTGDIYVTMINTSTNAVTKTKVSVDVTTDTLTSLATKLNAVTNLTSSVVTSGSDNFLKVEPASGYTFDFSASIDPNPDLSSFAGATPTMSGSYTGSDNDTYTFTVMGSGGTVGSTSGLQIQVTDAASSVLQTIDIGDDYVPGSTIDVVDGLKMTLSGGLLAGAASFTTTVLNDPDTTNLIAGLGISRFFSGSKASDIAVESDIQNNVSLIAAGSGGASGDNSNAVKMAALQSKTISDTNTLSGRSFGEFLADTATEIGIERKLTETTRDVQRGAFEALQTLREQSVGVSIDEELSTMLKFEQMFSASARFVTTLNQSIDRILEI